MDNDTQLFKKIKDRMDLIPDSPNFSERGAYDAYLNVLNWIREAYVPTATSHSVKDVEGMIKKWETYAEYEDPNIRQVAEEVVKDLKELAVQSSPIYETKTAVSLHDGKDVNYKSEFPKFAKIITASLWYKELKDMVAVIYDEDEMYYYTTAELDKFIWKCDAKIVDNPLKSAPVKEEANTKEVKQTAEQWCEGCGNYNIQCSCYDKSKEEYANQFK